MTTSKEDGLEIMIGGSGGTVARDLQTSRSHLIAARNAQQLGDREGAVIEFERSVQADPDNAEAMFLLAYNLDLGGEEDEAIALYERCVECQPAHINALVNLAICYEDRGSYRKAEKCLRQVLDTEPNHPRAKLFMKDVVASFDMEIDEEIEKDITKRSALLDTPVTDFELSVRARNCLKKMSIRTLGDLLRITEAGLLGYKNFGETSLQEIKIMLTDKGLRLGQGLDEQHDMVRRAVYDAHRGSPEEHLLSKPVLELDLTVRARKALQLLDIHTIGDLCARTEAELLGVKNFGATSLVEIKAKLVSLNLTLRQLDLTDEQFLPFESADQATPTPPPPDQQS